MNYLNFLERNILNYISGFDINRIPTVDIIASDLSMNIRTVAATVKNLIYNKKYEPAANLDFDSIQDLFNRLKLNDVIFGNI